jgi:2Fe-2S ferredoxin
MAHITYVAHDGSRTEVAVELGSTVMQGAIENSVSGIIAECGGCCSCATCHCYVDQAWLDNVGEPSAVEKEIIECAIDPRPNSRLSCQIEVTEELDGLVVYLPEAQY